MGKSLTGIAAAFLLPVNAGAGSTIKYQPYHNDTRADDETFWKLVKSQFSLEDGLLYFNNGSLGPSPEYVIDKTERFRRTLDGFPSRYMWGGWNDQKEDVRKRIAAYFSVDSEEIAIIHNTTEGMNLFARSFDLKAGDEIILADHEHRTGVAPYEYFCEARGVKLVRPVLPILPSDQEEIIDIYKKSITGKTRLISMVHMTNTNGMFLPVREVSEIAHSKGINVCVDAAQTAGMVKTSLGDLGCDFYAASGHKWLFGPKGTGVLWAAKDKQHMLKPLILSNNWENINIRMFEDYNTRNLPELLGLGSAVDYNNLIGQERKEQRIYMLKKYFRNQFEDDRRFDFKTPGPDNMSCGIQVIEVRGKEATDVQKHLFDKYGIDCRPMTSHNLNALRISLSVFNTIEDVGILVEGLKQYAAK